MSRLGLDGVIRVLASEPAIGRDSRAGRLRVAVPPVRATFEIKKTATR